MANTTVNKVVLGNETLLDLTADTVTPQTLYLGTTAHDASGAAIVGTMSGGGVDGDNLAYGGAYVGTAIVGSAVLTE